MALTHAQGDFFDKARRVAVAALIAAGAATIVGSTLDWVTISERPVLQQGVDFQEQNRFLEEPEVTEPFTGLEAEYGYYSLAGGIVVLAGALLLLWRKRGKYAWLAFIASIGIGAIAISAYRGIADSSSALYQTMDIIGRAEPALGVTLVTAGAIVGLLASVVGVAATPYRTPGQEAA
jgi:LPXTG-motif cell wall-anchored protein